MHDQWYFTQKHREMQNIINLFQKSEYQTVDSETQWKCRSWY